MIDRDRVAMAERLRRTRRRAELLSFFGHMILFWFALIGFCVFLERVGA